MNKQYDDRLFSVSGLEYPQELIDRSIDSLRCIYLLGGVLNVIYSMYINKHFLSQTSLFIQHHFELRKLRIQIVFFIHHFIILSKYSFALFLFPLNRLLIHTVNICIYI